MQKILFTVDDINYKGGAHYVTFQIANFLVSLNNSVSIYSPRLAEAKTKKLLDSRIVLSQQGAYSNYNFVVVPFENSIFKEEVSQLGPSITKIQWIQNDYEKVKDILSLNIEKERGIFEKFDKLVFVSEYIKLCFLKIFPELSDKSCVVYNFIDSKRIRTLGDVSVDKEIFKKESKDQLNIVLSGRLEPQKAFHRVIDIIKILNQKGLKINWYILGDGTEYVSLHERCKKYSIINLHFLGFRSNPYPFVKQADLFALLSEYEGLALVIAESLVLGTPVIATDTGATCEILNSKYGWIVDDDIFQIVNKIEELYNNKQLISDVRKSIKNYEYNNKNIEHALMDMFHIRNNDSQAISTYIPPLKYTNDSVDISVIVPVYNVEQYLEECLESLVHQSFENYEIIIINDGSPDNSIQIIERYVYRFPEKIRAFTIENSGLGEARNYGISKAKGNYLAFVDSDDFVSKDMLKNMYSAAIKNNADCVLTDYIAIWEDGRNKYISSIDEKFPDRFDILKYSTKYGVVNIGTKLLNKRLFDIICFPKGFYEDLATTPILLSYAKKIHYLKEGLYFYRQRAGSITSIKKQDARIFDCYKAWDRIIAQSNPLFKNEITFAVYWSINFFCTNFLDDFTMYCKQYFDMHSEWFIDNAYINDAIKKKKFLNFSNLPQIPKKIHYCWFGQNDKSKLNIQCMESWKIYAEDFEIIEWNETNCNINENVYVKKAYEEKNYAFVSDYFRLKALYEHGGVYLDTDMELMMPLAPYLYNSAFFAFETPIFIHAGIIGATKNSNIIEKILHTFNNDEFIVKKDGSILPIPRRISQVLEEETDVIKNGKTQLLKNQIKIYSANIMTLDFHDGCCVANHHYEGSWLKKDDTSYTYAYEVLKHYFTWDYQQCNNFHSPFTDQEIISQRNYYKSEYERLENSTCWKITKPIRVIGDFLKKLLHKAKH